jgi:hypothetical protein
LILATEFEFNENLLQSITRFSEALDLSSCQEKKISNILRSNKIVSVIVWPSVLHRRAYGLNLCRYGRGLYGRFKGDE